MARRRFRGTVAARGARQRAVCFQRHLRVVHTWGEGVAPRANAGTGRVLHVAQNGAPLQPCVRRVLGIELMGEHPSPWGSTPGELMGEHLSPWGSTPGEEG
eukprot:172183-Chlamydomonas_euryale.AAC.1